MRAKTAWKLLWVVCLAMVAAIPATGTEIEVEGERCRDIACKQLCMELGCFTGYCVGYNSGCRCITCPYPYPD